MSLIIGITCGNPADDTKAGGQLRELQSLLRHGQGILLIRQVGRGRRLTGKLVNIETLQARRLAAGLLEVAVERAVRVTDDEGNLIGWMIPMHEGETLRESLMKTVMETEPGIEERC